VNFFCEKLHNLHLDKGRWLVSPTDLYPEIMVYFSGAGDLFSRAKRFTKPEYTHIGFFPYHFPAHRVKVRNQPHPFRLTVFYVRVSLQSKTIYNNNLWYAVAESMAMHLQITMNALRICSIFAESVNLRLRCTAFAGRLRGRAGRLRVSRRRFPAGIASIITFEYSCGIALGVYLTVFVLLTQSGN